MVKIVCNTNEKSNKYKSSLLSLGTDRALISHKCSMKESAKFRIYIYLFKEICLQWNKWLGTVHATIYHSKFNFCKYINRKWISNQIRPLVTYTTLGKSKPKSKQEWWKHPTYIYSTMLYYIYLIGLKVYLLFLKE